MKILQRSGVTLLFLFAGLGAASTDEVLTGQSAFVSSITVKPGLFRKVTVDSLPKPFATESATTKSRIVPRPEGLLPQAPAGFHVNLFATGVDGAARDPGGSERRHFCSGDAGGTSTCVSRHRSGWQADRRIRFLRAGFHEPYGMVFYPAGKNPQWLYVANTDSVVRYALLERRLEGEGTSGNGDCRFAVKPPARPGCGGAYDRAVAVGKAPPDHGHWTRDLAFSLDGKKLFVGVGSASNLRRSGRTPERNSPREHFGVHAGWEVRRSVRLRYP